MKRLFSLLFSLCAALTAHGQTIELRVVDSDDNPIAFAHVYLNDTPLGVVDSSGKILIPTKKLTPGDTLRASYVGMDSGRAVYDQKARDEGKLVVVLTVTALDEVTVKSKRVSPHDLLKKYVKFRGRGELRRILMTHKFVADIRIERNGFSVEGKGYWEGGQVVRLRLADHLIDMKDDKEFIELVTYAFGGILSLFWNSVISAEYIPGDIVELKYNGITDGKRRFDMRVKTRSNPFIRQTLYSDVKSREIVGVESLWHLSPEADFGGSILNFFIDLHVVGKVLFPYRIEMAESSHIYPQYSRWVFIDNIEFVEDVPQEFKDNSTMKISYKKLRNQERSAIFPQK